MNENNNTPAVRVQSVGRISSCRSCGASIVWIKTVSGKAMPCDASPVYYTNEGKGRDRAVRPDGVTVSCDIVEVPQEGALVGYRPHWSTCNAPEKFRKEK